MDRRRFIYLGSQIGVAAAGLLPLFTLPSKVFAQSNSKFKNLITVHFDGGWDVMLGLDPQVKPKSLEVSESALYIGYRPDEIKRFGNLRLGPAAAPSLSAIASHCVVVNGMSMLGNISHEDAKKMALTGVIDRRIPQLVGLQALAERDIRGAVLVLASAGNLVGQLDIDEMLAEDVESLIAASISTSTSPSTFLDTDGLFARREKNILSYGENVKMLLDNQPRLLEIASGDTRAKKLSLLAIALSSGLVDSAHLELSPRGQAQTLDTHFKHHAVHLQSQADCWQQLRELVELLKAVPNQDGKDSLFNESLIVVTSEFSREPGLNGNSIERDGKEHNGYTNSCLLLGGGLSGGYSIGESVIQLNMLNKPTVHTARNFDFHSGTVIRDRAAAPQHFSDPKIKKQIQPCHIVSTVADMLDIRPLLDPALKDLPSLPIKI